MTDAVAAEPSRLRLEVRPDGSLLLTYPGTARWGLAGAGLGAAGLLTGAMTSGPSSLLEAVVLVPLALIALLAGLAGVTHRDWILFDRRGRQIAHRRGLAALFRPVGVLAFDDVEAIVVERRGGDETTVQLRRAGAAPWPVDRARDPVHLQALVTALSTVGGWRVEPS